MPTIRSFEVEGRGYGIAEVYKSKTVSFDAVRVTFVRPGPVDIVEEVMWIDDEHTSLNVITNDKLLVRAMVHRLSLFD
ncbi:MAG TPA: hypothetical protein VK534_02420 [Methylomirabilota bacterium]|nr:hypothetical protein [Methylomirabilota bacterium]